MRLQQFMSRAGVCSRRAAETLISQGVVTINGEVVREMGVKIIPHEDIIKVRGRKVALEPPRIYIFNKPSKVISTLSDTHGRKTIADFIRPELGRLFPIGRLDYDVHGLMLLTNDGDYAERMAHPRFEVERVYEALVEGQFASSELEMLRCGVPCVGDVVAVKSVSVLTRSRYLSKTADEFRQRAKAGVGETREIVRLSVAEGRKHLVKNILASVGHPVVELVRVAFGPYRLGNVAPGSMREVSFLHYECKNSSQKS